MLHFGHIPLLIKLFGKISNKPCLGQPIVNFALASVYFVLE